MTVFHGIVGFYSFYMYVILSSFKIFSYYAPYHFSITFFAISSLTSLLRMSQM